MSITRSNQNADEQAQILRNANKKRQQTFMKEQLSKKFYTKFGLDKLCSGSSQSKRNESAIMKIIVSQFDIFISQKDLTQNSLQKFEASLIDKLNKVLVKEGVIKEGQIPRQANGNSGSLSSRGAPLQMIQNNLQPRGNTAGHTMRNRPGRSLGVAISKDQSLPNIMPSVFSPANRAPSQMENSNPNHKIVSNIKKNHVNINNLFQDQGSKLSKTINVIQNPLGDRNKSTDYTARASQMMRSIEVTSKPDQYNYAINLNNDAALRVKMGAKKNNTDNSLLPDEIADDHWAEINNYQYQLFLEDEEKKKNEKLKKRDMVRETLQKQLQQQDQLKQQRIQYDKNIDTRMLNNAKKELDVEKKKQREYKKKVELQKVQQDVMLLESQARKMQQYAQSRQQEKVEVTELKRAIQQEKADKLGRKRAEREAAMKVIKENEKDRARRIIQAEQDKILAQKMLADEEALQVKEEQKRVQIWEERDRKIKQKLERMGDVMKKSNAAEKELERKIMNDQLKKGVLAEKNEVKRKQVAKDKLKAVNETLDRQVQDKKQIKIDIKQDNQKFINMIIQQDERDKNEDKKALIQHKNKIMDVAQFQKHQILSGNRPMDIGLGISSNDGREPQSPRSNAKSPSIFSQSGGYQKDALFKKKREVEQMSIEELRINRKLLHEIAQKKKESSAHKSLM